MRLCLVDGWTISRESVGQMGEQLKRVGDTMTRMEFYAECTARTLFPLQVLEESPEIKQALRERDDDKVRELLDNFA